MGKVLPSSDWYCVVGGNMRLVTRVHKLIIKKSLQFKNFARLRLISEKRLLKKKLWSFEKLIFKKIKQRPWKETESGPQYYSALTIWTVCKKLSASVGQAMKLKWNCSTWKHKRLTARTQTHTASTLSPSNAKDLRY